MKSLCKLHWRWSSFGEETEFYIYYGDEQEKFKELKRKILSQVMKISRGYTFDCGDIERPLNPTLLGVEIIPVAEAEYISFLVNDFKFVSDAMEAEKKQTKKNIEEKNNYTKDGNDYNYNISEETKRLFGMK